MAASDHLYRYSVAWIDLCAPPGRHLGRALLSSANHASLAELPRDELRRRPRDAAGLSRHRPDCRTCPSVVPNVFNKLSIKAFNELWYRKTPKYQHHTETLTGFFHPLDMVGWWNRLYGRKGFLQYQFVVPDGAVSPRCAMIVGEGGCAWPRQLRQRPEAVRASRAADTLSFPTAGVDTRPSTCRRASTGLAAGCWPNST